MNRKQMTAERGLLLERITFLDACLKQSRPKRSVLDFKDLTACKNKVRQPGYWHRGIEFVDGRPVVKETWIPNAMTEGCQYDRREIDPACGGCKMLVNA